MSVLHFDCFAGISGDMTLGALIDLGVDQCDLRTELNKLKISGWSLDFTKDQRCGITGTKAVVNLEDGGNAHDHNHWAQIKKIISESELKTNVKERALKIFSTLAEAEAEVHGVPVDEVAFHEVGALDSIIDITGAAICLSLLAPDKITCGAIELGGGTVKCAHGILPVPAPATLKLCKGLPVTTGGFDKEMTTPTGAAILASSVDQFISTASFTEIKSAYGIGHRKMDKPNVLRVSLREESCAEEKTKTYKNEKLFLLETNIDDMSGEALGFLMNKLFDEGALDVTFTPCTMKKSRPAVIVSALCDQNKVNVLRHVMFKHSTTIGLRETPVNRVSLVRKNSEVDTSFGSIKTKTVYLDDGKTRSKIEYEDRARIADKNNLSLKEAEQSIKEAIKEKAGR